MLDLVLNTFLMKVSTRSSTIFCKKCAKNLDLDFFVILGLNQDFRNNNFVLNIFKMWKRNRVLPTQTGFLRNLKSTIQRWTVA